MKQKLSEPKGDAAESHDVRIFFKMFFFSNWQDNLTKSSVTVSFNLIKMTFIEYYTPKLQNSHSFKAYTEVRQG